MRSTPRAEWDRILAVNLTGSFLVMQAARAASRITFHVAANIEE